MSPSVKVMSRGYCLRMNSGTSPSPPSSCTSSSSSGSGSLSSASLSSFFAFRFFLPGETDKGDRRVQRVLQPLRLDHGSLDGNSSGLKKDGHAPADDSFFPWPLLEPCAACWEEGSRGE